MRDGPLRRGLKAVARWRFAADLWLTRRVRRLRYGPPRYRLAGDCNGCGACCERPTVRVSRWLLRMPLLRRVWLGWHRWVNGFELVGWDTARGTVAFHCTHFDAQTRRCDSYGSRPAMCRDYPRALLDDAVPEFFADCGYRAVDRNAGRLWVELDRLELAPDQRARLAETMHLGER